MWSRLTLGVLALALLLAWLTHPEIRKFEAVAGYRADVVNGETLFHSASCSACHGADLSGGLELKTKFGLFRVPNISRDPETGIGGWTPTNFLNAVLLGVSPEGRHYYPSFPYTSYIRMRPQDVLDIKAFIDNMPPVRNKVAAHELGFPWSIRRGIGLWKRRYLDASPHLELPEHADPLLVRGRYLAEGPGHCAECHTPRDLFGGLKPDHWLAGAPDLEGEGRVPNITPGPDGLGNWSAGDISYYLETGFDPDFDTVGGAMVKVQENLSRLDEADRQAIAAYLKALPGLPDE